jgi:hypothetical protein
LIFSVRCAQKAKQWRGAQQVPGDSGVDFFLDGSALFVTDLSFAM